MNKEFQTIKRTFDQKESQELLSIWTENDDTQWRNEAFLAIADILRTRGITLPEQRHRRTDVGEILAAFPNAEILTLEQRAKGTLFVTTRYVMFLPRTESSTSAAPPFVMVLRDLVYGAVDFIRERQPEHEPVQGLQNLIVRGRKELMIPKNEVGEMMVKSCRWTFDASIAILSTDRKRHLYIQSLAIPKEYADPLISAGKSRKEIKLSFRNSVADVLESATGVVASREYGWM